MRACLCVYSVMDNVFVYRSFDVSQMHSRQVASSRVVTRKFAKIYEWHRFIRFVGAKCIASQTVDEQTHCCQVQRVSVRCVRAQYYAVFITFLYSLTHWCSMMTSVPDSLLFLFFSTTFLCRFSFTIESLHCDGTHTTAHTFTLINYNYVVVAAGILQL